MDVVKKSCCVPKRPTDAADQSRAASAATAPTPEPAGAPSSFCGARKGERKAEGALLPAWVSIAGGEFLMGTDDVDSVPGDGEGPRRQVFVSDFAIAPTTVTNREFAAFVRDTQYVTEAEQCGASFVFYLQVPEAIRNAIRQVPAGLPWWLSVEGACWQRPEGPGSHIHERLDHPVVHVSWNDAQSYCSWAGVRLPTEAEWEYAARGGLSAKKYPWGDELEPGGRSMCNIFRGSFPNVVDEAWRPAPMAATAYAPNGFGLYNVAGNVWEWCEDWFSPEYHLATPQRDPRWDKPTGRRTMRGGSFLCHVSYCNRYRVAARSANTPESSSSNCGFRVAAARTRAGEAS